MRFRFYRLRFHFRAQEPLFFPAGKTGNLLRGSFGSMFRSIVCVPECMDAKTCDVRAECPYARTFEPASVGDGPSGLSDWPRPFVFRANHLDGCTVTPGNLFHFDVHLFQIHDPATAYFVLAFAQLAKEGFGPARGAADLCAVDQIDADGTVMTRIFDGRALFASIEVAPSEVSLECVDGSIEGIRVHFRTPTELKHDQQLIPRPEFGVLMARIRDRLSTLGRLYDDGPLQMDFAAFGRRAELVRIVSCELREVHVTRRSSRTGQRHSIGGFVGTVEYAGELAEFVPFLRAARFAGVGRQTAWGKGEITLEPEA